jgi:hypothetical protein
MLPRGRALFPTGKVKRVPGIFTPKAGFPTDRKPTACHADNSGVRWEVAMSVYVDEGFRPCVTECATVAFRVCFDDQVQVFEVSAEALMTYCGAASKRRADLLVAFEDSQLEILKVVECKWPFKQTEPVRLGLDEFRMVRH